MVKCEVWFAPESWCCDVSGQRHWDVNSTTQRCILWFADRLIKGIWKNNRRTVLPSPLCKSHTNHSSPSKFQIRCVRTPQSLQETKAVRLKTPFTEHKHPGTEFQESESEVECLRRIVSQQAETMEHLRKQLTPEVVHNSQIPNFFGYCTGFTFDQCNNL